MRSLRSMFSLLLATSLLLVAHGLHLTLLPLRAGTIGFSEGTIGLSASFYYLGFVAGCFWVPRIIARVGHIRIFAALLALFTCAMLAIDLTQSPIAWFLLRFTVGATVCGAYTVIESWLTDQTPPDSRGQVLAVYTFLVLSSITVGQFLINLAPIGSSTLFIATGMLICLAIIPVALTKSLAPAPVPSTKLSFSLLYRRSRTAFAGALISGIVMGSFWSLGALYALRAVPEEGFVPLFISAMVIGGAAAQYPIGWLSDRIDRRWMLSALCVITAAASVLMTFSNASQWLLAVGFCFGASSNALYAISLAKAADNSKQSEFVIIASSVLLLNSIAAAIAPLLLGRVMVFLGDESLFLGLALASGVAAVYIGLQSVSGKSVVVDEQTPFVASGYETVPASFDNDPRSPDGSEADLEPMPERPAYAEFEAEFDFDELLEEE